MQRRMRYVICFRCLRIRPHVAKGLCNRCYVMLRYLSSKEERKKLAEYSRRHYNLNKEQKKRTSAEYRERRNKFFQSLTADQILAQVGYFPSAKKIDVTINE